MKKIKDRLTLGLISGLGGGIAKKIVMNVFRKLEWAEFDGAERAMGLVLPAHKITTKRGKLVGHLVDATIAGLLGAATVYTLSITGRDNAKLKGASSGVAFWTCLYGVLGSKGLSTINPASPKTVLSQLVAHATYGLATATIATKLGDDSLFPDKKVKKGEKLPLIATNHPSTNNQQTDNEIKEKRFP